MAHLKEGYRAHSETGFWKSPSKALWLDSSNQIFEDDIFTLDFTKEYEDPYLSSILMV